MKNRLFYLGVAVSGLLALSTGKAWAQMSAETLYQRLSSGATCWQAGESRHCTYKIGDMLSIAITRVGEAGVLTSFPLSNCEKEVCAGMYADCAVVMATQTSPSPGAPTPLVYISPRNGLVYKSFEDCRRAR